MKTMNKIGILLVGLALACVVAVLCVTPNNAHAKTNDKKIVEETWTQEKGKTENYNIEGDKPNSSGWIVSESGGYVKVSINDGSKVKKINKVIFHTSIGSFSLLEKKYYAMSSGKIEISDLENQFMTVSDVNCDYLKFNINNIGDAYLRQVDSITIIGETD